MNIWLLKASEPIPIQTQSRVMRMGIIANTLAERGHNVLWWTSSFDHFEKKYHASEFRIEQINSHYRLAILHPPTPYYRNISLARIRNHQELASSFRDKRDDYPLPDLIICAYPTIELAWEGVNFAKRNNIPVIVDIRDCWPDIFLRIFPRLIRPLFNPLLYFMNKKAKYVFNNATHLMGMTKEFINWANLKTKRPPQTDDLIVPFAYSNIAPPDNEIEKSNTFWRQQGIKEDDFVVCFFGTLGKQFDIIPVIKAAANIERKEFTKIKIVICGNGESLKKYQAKAKNISTIIFPGRVDKNQIYSLLRISRIGLAPYKNNPDFLLSIPNKIPEYLSAGVPILSNIDGAIGRLLKEHQCGYLYNPNNLCEKLIELYRSEKKVASLSNNALSLYEKSFKASNVYNSFAEKLETHFAKESPCN